MTSDNTVHLAQKPKAEFDDVTQEFHVVLTCGTFLHPTQPPFDVIWQTPSGSRVSSTRYRDGQFLLRLPNPVEGGSYSCIAPKEASNASCAMDTKKSSMSVDGVLVRLTLLEGENARLRSLNSQLEQRMQQQVDAVNTSVNSRVDDVNTSVNNVNGRVDFLNNTRTGLISFNARLSSDFTSTNSDPILFTNVRLNLGTAYSPATGKFTVPVDGVYFFGATTNSGDSWYFQSAYVVVDGSDACSIRENKASQGSCQATVHLTGGQEVWVRSRESGHRFDKFTTSFNGFLLHADP